ncbi:Unconventional myosin-Ic [Goodea atripinnis]|uniref:Unconventional myosin-Ic n=1 Tax=Goodea atripinnis TaxID=208336 RepID=A0ABV0MIS9_9TELE
MKARRRAKRRQEAAQLIRRFIKGFIYRHEEYCAENDYFMDHVRYSFLKNLRKNLPKNVLDKNWPTPPTLLVEASEHLQRLHMRNMVIKYCRRVQPEWKKQMMQKVVASEIFKDQKDSYSYSVGRLFLDSRLGKPSYIPCLTQLHKHNRHCLVPLLHRTRANQPQSPPDSRE